LTGLNHI